MRGLASVLSGHRTQMGTMTNDWASVHEACILDGVFATGQHSLAHVIRSTCTSSDGASSARITSATC